MATTATVTNLSRQMVQLILDHPAFFTKQAGWQRTTATFANYTEEGARQVEEVRRTYPATLSILPGQSVSDLHPAIVNCSQVPALIAARILQVKTNESSPDAKPEAKPAATKPDTKTFGKPAIKALKDEEKPA